MAPPLVLHLAFHGHSRGARELAEAIEARLNDDPTIPGLRVPCVIVPEDGSGLPPATYDLGLGERDVVVLIADDVMAAEPEVVADGRRAWPELAVDIARRCEGDQQRRLLPIQLSPHAWPLHRDLEQMSFARAYLVPQAERTAWVVRRIVVELLRFLGREQAGKRAPVEVFVSHAKQDIAQPPAVFEALKDYLTDDEPVQGWVDSGRIEAGESFAAAIEDAVARSAVLAIVTDRYSTRDWCRREILLAKQHQRPIVAIDALSRLDVRAFPYLGNVPVHHWNGTSSDPTEAVTLLLMEDLRARLDRLRLRQIARADDVVLPYSPELVTLVAIDRGASILHPDPPLPDAERRLAAPLGQRLATPIMRVAEDRRLERRTIALSCSESDDLPARGFMKRTFDEAVTVLSTALIVRGARLAYGGHLAPGGYTQALFDLVAKYFEGSSWPAPERIVSYIGWPLTITQAMAAQYRHMARFVRCPRPGDVEDLDPVTFVAEPSFFPADSPARRFAWARGMTEMRRRQAAEVSARVVIGGQVGPVIGLKPDGTRSEKWYSGRIPGVLEEATMTLDARKPLYVVGAFGGVGGLVADLALGRPRADATWAFHRAAPHAEAMRALYDARGLPWQDYDAIADVISEAVHRQFDNGLSADDNVELMQTRDIGRAIELIVEGLCRIDRSRPPEAS